MNIDSSKSIWGHGCQFDGDGEEISSPSSWGVGRVGQFDAGVL